MAHVNTSVAVKAAETLELEDVYSLSEQAVELAFRKHAKLCHPDAGMHDPARWMAIGHAKENLLGWLRARAATQAPALGRGDCRACAGLGYVQRRARTGFGMGPRMFCSLCDGSGNVKRKDRDE